ncbi:MAG TPA: hypothetical protein VG325_04960 [Solirubrobacteraceae bacterium]|jgi:hypothetical protein|nr:hypothetical protein [Solirubrobacteraceae bacterium]
MSEREDYDRLADDLGAEADKMERENERLEGEISDVRQDWERKRADEGVPGAAPRNEDADRDAPGDEAGPEDAERQERD